MDLGNGFQYFFSNEFYERVSRGTIHAVTKTTTEADVISMMSQHARCLYYMAPLNQYKN
jgi:hypothetical protein